MTFGLAVRALLAMSLALTQGAPPIPPPRGLVNDFAGVLTPEASARIERIAQSVRDRTGGETAVVTMRDIGDRAPSDVALRIGREWKVVAMAPIADRKRNAGAGIRVVPRETPAHAHGTS